MSAPSSQKLSLGKAPLLAGVIGSPIAHSLSPLIHTIWASREAIDAHYVPIDVPDTDTAFKRAINSLQTIGFAGVNVTLPHKRRALAIADQASDVAMRAGAANMLTLQDGALYADNSDVFGFSAALDEARQRHQSAQTDIADAPKPATTALILGAGGAARGVILSLQALGVGEILIANRTRARADELTLGAPKLRSIPWEERHAALGEVDIVVNTTSLGKVGQPPLEIELDGSDPNLIVADIVYTPLKTRLLRDAEALNLAVIDGLSMLMHQAIPGFKNWLGSSPVVDGPLRKALIMELERRKIG